MSKLEKYYDQLPPWLQNIALSGFGWRIQRHRFDSSFDSYLQQYTERTFWDPEQVAEFRDQRLREFLKFAVDHTSAYRSHWGVSDKDLLSIKTLEDLKSLPIIGKSEVQAHQEELVSSGLTKTDYSVQHTSGSTGAGLRFPVTHSSHREQWAVWWRYRNWHGLTQDEQCIYLGGRSIVPLRQTKPPFWRYNWPGRQILLSGYHLSPETAKSYLDEIQRSGARWIHGYPSLISLLGQYALEDNRRLNFRWVTTGAESLLASQKSIIREAFGVEPLEHYGMAEGVANISQCPEGSMHVDEDYSAVEFVPTEQPDCYRVIGTGFSNVAFPLIRYDVGDIVTLASRGCSCGRPGRLVEKVDGRQEDFVIMNNGARLGRLDHIFKDSTNVKEAQIVQSKIGEMTVRVVRGSQFCNEDEQQLREEINKRVGEFLKYSIDYVDEIERTKRGKLRFVLSTVEES